MSNNYSAEQNFICHMTKFIGETVTVFTTSGGASGCGFSGVLLAVNCDYIRLSTLQGTPPSNPLSSNICGNLMSGMSGSYDCGHNYPSDRNTLGSVCDIPIDRIAAFCHNAV